MGREILIFDFKTQATLVAILNSRLSVWFGMLVLAIMLVKARLRQRRGDSVSSFNSLWLVASGVFSYNFKQKFRKIFSWVRIREYNLHKRSRKFVDFWRTEFPSASEVQRQDQNYLVCTICREYWTVKDNPTETDQKNNTFVYGCSSYRKTSLEAHSKCL